MHLVEISCVYYQWKKIFNCLFTCQKMESACSIQRTKTREKICTDRTCLPTLMREDMYTQNLSSNFNERRYVNTELVFQFEEDMAGDSFLLFFFFHEWAPPLPLTRSLNPFRIWFLIREVTHYFVLSLQRRVNDQRPTHSGILYLPV